MKDTARKYQFFIVLINCIIFIIITSMLGSINISSSEFSVCVQSDIVAGTDSVS